MVNSEGLWGVEDDVSVDDEDRKKEDRRGERLTRTLHTHASCKLYRSTTMPRVLQPLPRRIYADAELAVMNSEEKNEVRRNDDCRRGRLSTERKARTVTVDLKLT